jgi:hypothetical protein|tara:strand:+ start:846 stop:1055 length:210 start_codon:yes stop_codon:yes gene_type:complete
MKDGFVTITDFLDENKIDNIEKFVTKLPLFPKFIQTILAHRHKDYKFNREDMDKLFIYLMRDDDTLARA